MNVRPHVKLQNWMNEPLAGWMGKRTDGIGCGNVSRSRPPTNDKCSPLQLPQVDPHLCAVACFSHPNLEITHRRNPQYSQPAFFYKLEKFLINKFTLNIKNEQFSFHFNKFCFANQKMSQICAMKQLMISVSIQLLKRNFNVALH